MLRNDKNPIPVTLQEEIIMKQTKSDLIAVVNLLLFAACCKVDQKSKNRKEQYKKSISSFSPFTTIESPSHSIDKRGHIRQASSDVYFESKLKIHLNPMNGASISPKRRMK